MSRSSQLSSSSSRTNVDDSQNRKLPLGRNVHSGTSSSSRTYVDNAQNRRLGRVGLPLGSAVHSRTSNASSAKTYVDNAYNRKLGRVGLPLGSAVEHSCKTPGIIANLPKLMLDADIKQQLQDEMESLRSKATSDEIYKPLRDVLESLRSKATNDEDIQKLDQFEGILNRRGAANNQRRSGKKSVNYEGHIIDYAELELGDKIGSGGFADVYVGTWKNYITVAVKKLRVQRVSQQRKVDFENEIKLLSTLKHPTIVTFYGACVEPPNLAIVMEFMPKGSLHDIIFCESTQLTDKQKESIITDALTALDFIHARKVSHRDIKSRNILVNENLKNCKLADFGLALNNDSETSVTNVAGTIKYSAPEVLNGDYLTTDGLMAADVYSMALTIVELISEKEPFDGYNAHQILKAVLAGETPSLDDVSDTLKDLLRECLRKANSRPTAANFLSRYLDSINNSDERDL